MGAQKTFQNVIVATSQPDGGSTTGPTLNLTSAYSSLITGRIVNGTAPTTPAFMQVWVSGDGTAWRQYALGSGSVLGGDTKDFKFDLPPGALFAQVVFGGNVGAGVTVSADIEALGVVTGGTSPGGGGGGGSGGGGGGGTGGGGTGGTLPGDPIGTQAFRIADMIERFGFNVFPEPNSTATNWGSNGDYSWQSVAAGLNWITNNSGFVLPLRIYANSSSFSWQDPWIGSIYGATGSPVMLACAAGLGTGEVASVLQLAANHPNVFMIEGDNEPNLFGPDQATATAVQQAIKAGNPAAAIAVPSIAITNLPFPESGLAWFTNPQNATIRSISTLGNVHWYPPYNPDLDDGSNRNGVTNDALTGYQITWGNIPMHMTELDFTLYSNTYASVYGQVPSFTYNAYFCSWGLPRFHQLGFQSYMHFAMFDYGPQPVGSGGAGQFYTGLFPVTGGVSPRPQAYVLRTMCTITGDPNPNLKRSFTTSKLNVNVSGLPAPINGASPFTGGQWLLYQNSAGQMYLWIWNSQATIGGSPVTVTVSFGGDGVTPRTVARVRDYVISNGLATDTTPVQDLTNRTSLTISLKAETHVLVLDL